MGDPQRAPPPALPFKRGTTVSPRPLLAPAVLALLLLLPGPASASRVPAPPPPPQKEQPKPPPALNIEVAPEVEFPTLVIPSAVYERVQAARIERGQGAALDQPA